MILDIVNAAIVGKQVVWMLGVAFEAKDPRVDEC